MYDNISHPGKRAFLAAFAETGNVSESASIAGVSREAHYDWKAQDADYAAAFEEAKQRAGDALEDEAVKRARGEHGSDRLLIFLLQGNKPEKFKHRVATEHTGAVKHQHSVDLTGLTDDELALLDRIFAPPAQPERGSE